MGIYAELSRIQQELRAPKVLYNKFGNYYYRNAEGILEAVKPLLNGLCLLLSDKIVNIGDRYYVEATATLTNGEESVSVTACAREDETKKGMDGCQITGACSSYARKYALNGLFDIDDTKDSDDDSLSPKNPDNEKRPVTPATVTTAQTLPEDPVRKFFASCMTALREKRGITSEANKSLFMAQFTALKNAKLAPDKDLSAYSLAEAQALIDAMQKCFDLTGTELKVS